MKTYIHHKTHRFCWCWHTRGCHARGRSSLGTWFCRLARGRWFPVTVCHGPRSHQGTGSCSPGGSHRTQTTWAGHSTVRGCHLQSTQWSITSSLECNVISYKLFLRAMLSFCKEQLWLKTRLRRLLLCQKLQTCSLSELLKSIPVPQMKHCLHSPAAHQLQFTHNALLPTILTQLLTIQNISDPLAGSSHPVSYLSVSLTVQFSIMKQC